MKRCIKLASLVLVTLAITSFASADTLQLVGVNGATTPTGGVYVGPYQISVDGTITNLFCLDFDRDISFGETWTATPTVLSTSSTTEQKEAAILYSLIQDGTLDPTIGQIDIWAIRDPSLLAATGESSTVASAQADFITNTILPDALNAAVYGDSFYSRFIVYVAKPESQSSGGTAQDFIGDPAPTPVPEPSTLLMMGSGLLGAAGMLRRRISRS